MAYLNTKERYGSLSLGLHWLTFLVMIGVFACVELHENFPKGDPMRGALMGWHFQLGLLVLILAVLRIVLKVRAPDPEVQPPLTRVQHLAAKAMHGALYLIMLGMPVAGYIGRMLAGRPTVFFGIPLPTFLAENKDLAENVFDLHGLIGNTAYFLIGIHAAAALYHHYFQKDNTLLRMLPAKKQ